MTIASHMPLAASLSVSALIALAGVCACHAAADATLGLFFGGLFIAAAATPLFAVSEERCPGVAAGIVAAFVVATWIGWLFVAGQSDLTSADFLPAAVILATWAAALSGFAKLLQMSRVPASLAGFIAIVLGLAWLAAPVWLSPMLAGRDDAVALLADTHPLLSLNGALRHLDFWHTRPLAYAQLTVLQQHVVYSPPQSIAMSALLHGGLGAVCWGAVVAVHIVRARRG